MRLNLTALAKLPMDALHDAIREQVIAQLLADKDERNRKLGEQMRASTKKLARPAAGRVPAEGNALPVRGRLGDAPAHPD